MKQQILIQISPEELDQLFEAKVQKIIEQTNILKKAESLPENLTKNQVADYWQVSTQTVSNWEKQGILKRYPLKGMDGFRYSKKEVLAIKQK